MLIAIEGVDQSGKATQAQLLREYLEVNVGCDSMILSFPDYNTPAGQIIKEALDPHSDLNLSSYEMQLMHVATRYHWKESIEEALADEFIVICDRYTESAVVYGEAIGLPITWINQLQRLLPQSDLNILLNIPVELALQRKPRNRDKYESDVEFLTKVSNSYKMRAVTQPKWVIVDGARKVEDVSKDVIKTVTHWSNYHGNK